MFNRHKYPFVRLLIPFGMGIWIGLNRLFSMELFTLSQLAFSFILLAIVSAIWLKSYRWRWVFGLTISLSLIFGGMLIVKLKNPLSNPQHLSNQASLPESQFIARIIEPPQIRELTVKATLELISVKSQDSLKPLSGKFLAYFQRTENMPALAYGDIVAFDKKPEKLQEPSNPGQFDYGDYLANKQIFHQIYLRSNNWFKTGFSKRNTIYSRAFNMRDFLLQRIRENKLTGDEFGVAAAILLGYDESLPAYLRKGYVAAGAMHVLCVSGLHVGIVFLIFSFLLGFLNRKGWQSSLKTILLLAIVWFYALLTGLSPSIQRASLMISFVLIGQLTNRKGFAVNSIAASAFFLLFIRPENLLEIGFQLSYAAVIGIILLQRPIAAAIYVKNKYLSKIWDVTAVALAAQLATTPFVLYYFNQFPTYFWLSNLFLVPLSFIIIVCGMGLLLLSFLPLVAGFLGKILSALIFMMNWIIRWIEGLPGSVIQGLYVNAAEFALLLAIVMLLVMLVSTKKMRLSFLLLSLGIVLFASFTWRRYEQTNSTKLVIYDLQKHSVVDFIHGRGHILMTDSITLADDFVKGFHLEGHWVESGLNTNPNYFEPHTKSFSTDYLRKRENLISFEGKLLALWQDEGGCNDSLSYRIQIDWMLVSGRESEKLEKLLNCYDPSLLILDGSVPHYYVKAWKEAALKAGVELYHTSEQGAFIYERRRDFLNRQ